MMTMLARRDTLPNNFQIDDALDEENENDHDEKGLQAYSNQLKTDH